jgi:hypothetical protein
VASSAGAGAEARALTTAVGIARHLVALGVVVLDPHPLAVLVDVADDLLVADLGLELHALAAEGALDGAPGFHVP